MRRTHNMLIYATIIHRHVGYTFHFCSNALPIKWNLGLITHFMPDILCGVMSRKSTHDYSFSCTWQMCCVISMWLPVLLFTADIKTSFDSVDWRALWKILRSKGVPDILMELIEALHENTGAQVCSGKNLSGRFQTTSGVRQGCILAVFLYFSHVHLRLLCAN